MATDINESGTEKQDPSQLVPPEVEAGLRIKGIRGRDVLHGAPGFILLAISGLLLVFTGWIVVSAVIAGMGVVLAAAGIGVAMTAHEFTTGIDRVWSALNYLIKQQSLPMSQEEATGVHGVKRIHSDGTAETTDDRIVVLARIYGRNTDLQVTSEFRPMIGMLRQSIDDDVETEDFGIFSTTVPFDPSDITSKYREQWLSSRYAGSEWADTRALLSDIIEWETDQEEEIWETREWQHYLVVSVAPDEIDLPDMAIASSDRSRWEEIRVALGGDYQSEENAHWQARRRRMRSEAKQRLSQLQSAFGSVEGVETETVGPAEHALLLARYWAGTDHAFSSETVSEMVNVSVWPNYFDYDESPRPEAVDADETVSQTAVADVSRVTASADGGADVSQHTATTTTAHDDPEETLSDEDDALAASFLSRVREGLFAPSPDSADETTSDSTDRSEPIQDVLAPSMYDDREGRDGGYVVAGDQYCRTYWIADWPIKPHEKFLEQLYTLRGVDVDVHLRVTAKDKKRTIEQVKDTVGTIDTDIMDRRDEADDIEAILMENDLDPHVTLLKLLHQTDAKPWGLSGYVTVRAGSRRALDDAQALIDEGLVDESQLTLDVAKQQALNDACDTVTDVLERSPASLTPIADDKRQGELFESCSPNGRDAYADSSIRDRQRLTASGTIAAAFPPTSTYIRQEEGIEQGRSITNGSVIRNDPFDPGPGHILTAGQSGSGKTSDVLKESVRWYLQDPEDRTLIYTDTQTDFVAPTELLGGSQITLDGSVTINPLRMEPTPPELLQTTGLDPFEMKFTQVVELILHIVADSDELRDRFGPLVKDAVREAMEDAGLDPNDPSTHTPENSPTMNDVRKKMQEIGENPSDYADSELVAREIRQHAGGLLHRLDGFTPDGEYGFLTGESDETIEAGGVTYLDLQQLEGQGTAADASTMLNMALGQVYEAVKRAPGQTMFVIDEAHYLLESKEMLQWLSQSARHWRHNNAGLWFITQSPEDFVKDDNKDKERHKDTIRGQVNTVKLFGVKERLSPTAMEKFDLNSRQVDFLVNKATRGKDDQGYSDCLVDYTEIEGWVQSRVELSPIEELITLYEPNEDGQFSAYLDRELEEI